MTALELQKRIKDCHKSLEKRKSSFMVITQKEQRILSRSMYSDYALSHVICYVCYAG